jgi:hypothetical protein
MREAISMQWVPGHAVRRPTSPGLHTPLGKGGVQHHIIRKRSLDQRLLDDAVALHLIHGPCRIQCAVEAPIRAQPLRPKRLQSSKYSHSHSHSHSPAAKTAPVARRRWGRRGTGSSHHALRSTVASKRRRPPRAPRVWLERSPDEGGNRWQSMARALTVCDSSGGRA